MTLIKLTNNRYRVVQDNFDQIVELRVGKCVATDWSLEDISKSEWFGWKAATPNEMREAQKAEVLRTATKLKRIKYYCKTVINSKGE